MRLSAVTQEQIDTLKNNLLNGNRISDLTDAAEWIIQDTEVAKLDSSATRQSIVSNLFFDVCNTRDTSNPECKTAIEQLIRKQPARFLKLLDRFYQAGYLITRYKLAKITLDTDNLTSIEYIALHAPDTFRHALNNNNSCMTTDWLVHDQPYGSQRIKPRLARLYAEAFANESGYNATTLVSAYIINFVLLSQDEALPKMLAWSVNRLNDDRLSTVLRLMNIRNNPKQIVTTANACDFDAQERLILQLLKLHTDDSRHYLELEDTQANVLLLSLIAQLPTPSQDTFSSTLKHMVAHKHRLIDALNHVMQSPLASQAKTTLTPLLQNKQSILYQIITTPRGLGRFWTDPEQTDTFHHFARACGLESTPPQPYSLGTFANLPGFNLVISGNDGEAPAAAKVAPSDAYDSDFDTPEETKSYQ